LKSVNDIPFTTQNPKKGECPYCYSGHLIYDRLTKLIHCSKCNKAILLTDKDNKVITLH